MDPAGRKIKNKKSISNIISLERVFHLKQHHTDIQTEITAGITSFMAMSYILAVNPSILADAGMDKGAVFTATALSACIASCLMAFLAGYPFVLAPGLGLSVYFSYTVVQSMGFTWQMALAAVFVEGMIFIILSLTHIREAIFDAIPVNLKHSIGVGIGLFIVLIGLKNANIIVGNESTLVGMVSLKQTIADGTFSSVGITALLSMAGILILAFLLIKKIKGSILWSVLITWGLGILCQAIGVYVPDASLGMSSLLPDFSEGFRVPGLSDTFLQMDFSRFFSVDFVTIMMAFLYVDMFDTLGTLIGIASKAKLLDSNGKLPKIRGALLADALGTSIGACLGTSTTTTVVESASGVAEGGRTGLTAVTAGLLFGASLLLSPLFLAIPIFATTPALVISGFSMFTSVVKIDFCDYSEAIPCFITILSMPFFYSISEGISLGIISYVVLNLVAGKTKEKNISPLMYVLAGLFTLKYFVL